MLPGISLTHWLARALLLDRTEEPRAFRSRHRVGARGACDFVPRSRDGVRGLESSGERGLGSGSVALNGHAMTQRPSVIGDLDLHGRGQLLDQFRIVGVRRDIAEGNVSGYPRGADDKPRGKL